MEIISLHKRCNKTGKKTATKASTKTGAKAPRSASHLFLKEQFDKMTREDQKNCGSIISGMWENIKEDPAKLISYNNKARQMSDEAKRDESAVTQP